MNGISNKEIELISTLEFKKKYFFTSKDVDAIAKDKMQRYNLIKNLLKKGRIIKLNRQKYYLVPIKAPKGKWSENSFTLVDEIMDGKDYVIGGWCAAHYWHISDQIPFQVDVYTTRRQGKMEVFNTRIVFHRTTKKKTQEAVNKEMNDHPFKITSKQDTKKWLKSRK